MNQTKNNINYDVVIIGGGPAALSASIYALHGNLSVAFIEKEVPGGKLSKTNSIKNYPGFEDIHGADLAIKMLNQAIKLGAEFIFGEVVEIDHKNNEWKILTLSSGKKIKSSFLIIATGMLEKIPPIDKIDKFEFKGISYCAICDGGIYKGQEVAVIGGGDSAIEEAVYLSSTASKVHIFMRRDVFRANKNAVNEVKKIDKIIIHQKTNIVELLGDEKLNGIVSQDNDGIKTTYSKIKALFPYIGTKPQTKFINNLNITDKNGYIIVDEHMETKIPKIFAAGDVIQKNIRQISTAINDGTIAAKTIINKNAI